MKKVAILYGFGEGPGLASRLLQELRSAGYEIVSNAANADCIITHSSGCFDIPSKTVAQKIIIVCPSGYSGVSLGLSILNKLKQDISYAISSKNLIFLLQKTVWNLIYIAIRPLYTAKVLMLAIARIDKIPIVNKKEVVAVEYINDPWPYNFNRRGSAYSRWRILQLDRTHDDIWYNPKMYVSLIEQATDQQIR